MSGSLPRGVPDDFYAQAAAAAAGKGCRVILDTSGPALEAALGDSLWLVKPNRREFDGLAGHETSSAGERGRIAERLIREGAAEIVAATFGGEGTVLATADGVVHIPAAPIEPKSQVGAGDSYVGGLVLSLSRERDLVDSVMYAAAAAGSALTEPGPRCSETR